MNRKSWESHTHSWTQWFPFTAKLKQSWALTLWSFWGFPCPSICFSCLQTQEWACILFLKAGFFGFFFGIHIPDYSFTVFIAHSSAVTHCENPCPLPPLPMSDDVRSYRWGHDNLTNQPILPFLLQLALLWTLCKQRGELWLSYVHRQYLLWFVKPKW